MVSQYSGPLDHVLFLHLSLPNQNWLWRDGFQPTNCHMIDCLGANPICITGNGGGTSSSPASGLRIFNAGAV